MGNKKNNIIEINGKRYDAITGAPLDGFSTPITKPAEHHPTPVNSVVSKSLKTIAVHDHPIRPEPAKRVVHDALRAKAAKRHAPEHSKTLMRHTVKKPSVGLKRHVKAHGSTDHLLTNPSAKLSPKLSAKKVDSRKLNRASQVSKSHLVKKFNKSQPASVTVPVTIKQPISRPSPHHKPPKPVPAPTKRSNPTEDLLNHALKHATSHEQRPPKKIDKKRRGPSRRLTSITAIAFAVVVLGGFVAYSNITHVQLKVASAKAGFNASMPSQKPAGYHLSHLNYSPGVVALNFRSNSDNRSFNITEKASEWDSGTLRDTYVASSGQDYQTVESGGRTLYMLGRNAATWVSGGVWYQVQSNGALSSRQLVDLATSM